MKTSLPQLKSLLEGNVVEIKFVRRRPKAGSPPTRRMLCTTANTLLDSLAGQAVFKFAPPTKGKKYNPLAHNLIIAYDLFKQDFRAINAESVDVLSTIPVMTEEQMNEFWIYFNNNIAPMSADQKVQFINS